VQFNHIAQFTNLMRTVKPGTSLTFRVLRSGQVRDVPVRLDARPAAAAFNMPPDSMDRLENARATKAEEYWNRAFAPLLGQGSVTSSRP
jgi:hypothetical protein